MDRDKLLFWNQILNRYGYQSEFIPADGKIAYSRININLGQDYKGRPFNMEIKINSYVIPSEIKNIENHEQPQTEEELVFQFLVVLPFHVQPKMIGEVARLILLFNKSLDIGGFGLDEVTNLSYFKYSLFTRKGQLSPRVLLAVTGTIAFLVDSLMEQIETVAQGSTTKEMLTAYVNRFAGPIEESDLRKAS